jgi:hypothetical protein
VFHPGVFSLLSDENELSVDESVIDQRQAHMVHTITHELVHAVTTSTITSDSSAAVELRSIMQQVNRALAVQSFRGEGLSPRVSNYYGFTNLAEFIAEELRRKALKIYGSKYLERSISSFAGTRLKTLLPLRSPHSMQS